MTTAEAASDVPAGNIALTLTGYAIVYTLLLISYVVVLTQLAVKESRSEPTPLVPTAFHPERA